MRDVAVRAGVSVATVSRALAGSEGVSLTVRQRVQSAADELGYQPNRLPSNLRSKGVRILALVVGNVRNAYFPELIDGCVEAAHEAGYPLIFGDSNEDPGREAEILHQLAGERVAGVALASSDGRSAGVGPLLDLGIPVVAVDRRIPDRPLDSVTVDSERGVCQAMEHLIGLGHRRIGLIGGPPNLTTFAEREVGYRKALGDAGIDFDPALIVRGDLSEATARVLAPQLIRLERPPTAVVATNDLSTIGTMHALRGMGVRIPDDISLVGFDDVVGADLFDPPLSVIAQPVFDIGQRAIELLVRRVTTPDAAVEELRLEPHLVVRGSTAPARTIVSPEEV